MLRKSVCIVTITYETEAGMLEKCLRSAVASAEAAGCDVDVLIIDNGSQRPPDISDRWATGLPLRILRVGRNEGFARAANMGLQRTGADYVLLLNPDTVTSTAAIGELLSAVAGDRTLACGWLEKSGQVQVDAYLMWWFSTGRLIARPLYRRILEAGERCGKPFRVQKLSGGALFGSRATLFEVSFDEAFFLYGEDVDFSYRAQRIDIPLMVVPGARINHEAATSQRRFGALVERARTDAALRLLAKHKSYPVSLFGRLELAIVSCIGVVGGGRSSASRGARLVRLHEIRRWGVKRMAPRFDPTLARGK